MSRKLFAPLATWLALSAWGVALPAGADEPTEKQAPSDSAEKPASPAESAAPVAPAAPPVEAPKDDAQASLDARVDALMDRMVRARTRIAALGEALFETRVEIYVDNRVDDYRLGRLRLFVDGAPVHDSEGEGLVAGKPARLYSGYAAPGMHELLVQVEQRSTEDDRYQYALTERYRFRVPEKTLTELRLRFDDDSDVAEDFEDDQDGEYDVRTRLRVQAHPLEAR